MGSIYVVLEYMNAGSLASFIVSNYKKIDEDVIAYILGEVLAAI